MSKSEVGKCMEESMGEIGEVNSRLENLYQYEKLQDFGKIAYIESGLLGMNSIGDNFLYRNILTHVDLYEEFHKLDLRQFSAIVLPMGIDEYYLSFFKDKILHYLNAGGVLLSFMSDFMRILPFSSGYIQSQTPIRERVVRFAKSKAAEEIFQGVSEYDINHRRGVKGFFNRGYFDMSAFPHTFEPLLEDSEGQCVGYIDRISTAGIILSAANADLLGFGLFDNTTARKMGLNCLKWLEGELLEKDYKTLRMNAPAYEIMQKPNLAPCGFLDFRANKSSQHLSNPKLKNAIITGGSAFHAHFFSNKNAKYANFFSHRAHFLHIGDMDFNTFDYITLSSRLNVKYLLAHKQKFVDYLNNGGHIVSFGEVRGDYLPNIIWKDYPVNFWWWLIPGANMPLYALENGQKCTERTSSGLFSKIPTSVAKWHYHGAFYPPKNAQSILVNELDESIIYKDNNFKGNLYITSLDPEFHLGQGFMPTTEPFFDAFMAWVEEDCFKDSLKDSPKEEGK